MLELRIARRFLWRSKVQSILIILGIAVGIAVQVFVGSLITSLQDSLVKDTVGSSPQVALEPPATETAFSFTTEDRESVGADPRITAIAPVQSFSALVSADGKSVPVIVKGAALADLDSIYKISARLVDGNVSLTGSRVVAGKDLVEQNGLSLGDQVRLVLADGTGVEALLEGVFDLGAQAANEQFVFSGSELAGAALNRPADQVSAVELQIDDVFASPQVAADLATAFPGLTISEWQTKNADLLTALQSQSTSSYMIQVFVIIAVMLGIASTLAISAVQKTRQIGILKALGMSDTRTGLVFLYQAGILGVIGTALGIAASLGLIAVFSLVAKSGGSGLFPIEPKLGFILVSAGIGIAIALISAVIPYRRTARLDPIQVIQSG
ncbi:MAG: FtsX-like permease family protein [Actinomycetia bacterium]|nr:FtsX-like permease family protein [Actinomycetes bacterium]